jgi:hypothetical protein
MKREDVLKLLNDELKYLNTQIVFEPDLDRDVKYCIRRIELLRGKVEREYD